MSGKTIDWTIVANRVGCDIGDLLTRQKQLKPILDAVTRNAIADVTPPHKPVGSTSRNRTIVQPARVRQGRPPKPRTIVEFPEPTTAEYEDCEDFAAALGIQIHRFRENVPILVFALGQKGLTIDTATLYSWLRGEHLPREIFSLRVLQLIEERYRLPRGYFRAKIPISGRAPKGRVTQRMSAAERRRIAWHLPDDFSSRPLAEQEEIMGWIRRVIVSGSTEYRRYQATAMKQRYAVRFQAFRAGPKRPGLVVDEVRQLEDLNAELESAVVDAPRELEAEMAALLHFKTSTLTAFGLQRNGVWNDETASQKVEHLGLMFGALASDPRSTVKGFGVPLPALCFAMLVFPAVWDWYLQWRERRRGFYTAWEIDMLSVVLGMIRKETGWLRQTPKAAERLVPIAGLISDDEIAAARADWDGACDAMHKHGRNRIR